MPYKTKCNQTVCEHTNKKTTQCIKSTGVPQRLLIILMSDFPFNSQHSCFWKTNNVHISDQPWQQQMPISSVTFSVLWFLYASPSRCLCEYNSQIMSSSVMYSQCSVCVDLQATLPPLSRTRGPGPLLAPNADYILFPKLLKVSEAVWLCFYIVLLMAVSTHRPSLCVCELVSN